ncbi:MAG: hypothetical protein GX066_08305, partial [Clostridiaceae bacterium]|nr:hypothetical protein [Clostridiaceae bacterium]
MKMKKYISLMLAFLMAFSLMPMQVIQAEGEATDLILWYKLDETSGTIANDSSGNGKHGTVNGGAKW